MRILKDTAVVLPSWVRVAFAVLAAVFGVLGWWLLGLAPRSGWLAWAGVGLSVTVAMVLAVSALRGRIWRSLWIAQFFVPG